MAEDIPTFRVYQHTLCGEQTIVSDNMFEVVSNPMSSMERTYCSSCGKMFPIAEYVWADTGELLSDYYARHTASATPVQRFLCSKTFMVTLIALCAVLVGTGVVAFVAIDGLPARVILFAGGGILGAFAGMAMFLSVFANPITRRVCGVSDTRLLK